MGKTHRNVYAGSNSVDYHSPQSRGFAKEKKANSHRKIRAHNKSANEDNIKSVNDYRKMPKLLFKNNNYIIQIDDYIVTITSFDFMDSDEFIFDKIHKCLKEFWVKILKKHPNPTPRTHGISKVKRGYNIVFKLLISIDKRI